MTTTLQAFLLSKPSLFIPSSKRFHLTRYVAPSSSCLSFNPLSLSTFISSTFRLSPFRPRTLTVPCTLRPESAGFDSERLNFSDTDWVSDSKDSNFKDFDGQSSSFNGNISVSEFGNSKNDEFGGGNPEIELKSEFGEVGLENGGVGSEGNSEKVEQSEGKEQNLTDREGKGGNLSGAEIKSRIPFMVFLMGIWVRVRKGFEKFLERDWLSWWPFWRQEKRLDRLIAEADANPKDVVKQNVLLAELNKHSPESVIKRFEQRDHAVDSRGVAEYLRALVVTNAISEYLPDEETGKPSSLPTLLQELKQRASGNTDEAFVNPGISEKQPLHVVMVEPKVSNKSRFAQELISTILFTVAVGLVWLMGAAALQKYIGSLGGIGTSGVGSSSSYAPKELNRDVMPEKNVKTFKDVKGCDDAKQELEEVVEYLKNPSKFTRLGGKLPKGILLTGAPGTGKTLLAKAIAGEAGVPFFYRAGSEFEEMFVGVGARRVRSLFQAAKKKAPCIIFIDEIDAVGSTRKQWEGHTKKTLHQLLVEMDGFEQNEGIILMAATNLPDILDPALTRPGRFDRHIVVPNPDVRGRQEILELYLQDKPLADNVDVKAIARGTPGFNGADLANLVNIAAIKAAVEGAEKLTASQLEFAKDRIMMGTERKTMFISEESKKLTAFHESGHAIVAFNTEAAHPIHKATIMPRGSALGMVTQLPSSDETSVSKKQLLARLDVCMGGRVAEELIFGQDYVTTGASSDLYTATELAHYMVSNCGMSDTIGPVHIKERPSSEMQSRIDAEVVRLLRDAYDRVKALLKKHEKALHALANALLEYETLSAEEIKRILLPYREGRLPEQQEEPQEEGDLVLV
ncbi:ATP-dependent zinc metalloprotease FTSH 11, chloroplastic/mitochondrial-like [Juglans regia]|uniref:ATP-dependent zinc metalloprotease FTSH 11, chloroplastic/mitochondrial-like n=1 Tax=Juglans regia TaxID=51240 RepID=A0A6P9EB95_JUGRE|nr:ATP-dependent zinc metalloprotease FTSH 11, chloroplastic/mitochondrial-like [Juglans regia]